MTRPAQTVDAYIAAASPEAATILERIRAVIREAVPGSGETIKYAMPTATLDGRSLVHYAAWKHHVGLYPLPTADGALADELRSYATEKGTARFPYAEPIPYDLIGRAVAALAAQRAG